MTTAAKKRSPKTIVERQAQVPAKTIPVHQSRSETNGHTMKIPKNGQHRQWLRYQLSAMMGFLTLIVSTISGSDAGVECIADLAK